MNIQSISNAFPPQPSTETSSVLRETKAALATDEGPQPEKSISGEQLSAAVKNVQEYIRPYNNGLEFSVNSDTHQFVVKIIDTETKEVIRQIPSEEMIAIAKALDTLQGLFVKQKA